jgi:hypothetical protein
MKQLKRCILTTLILMSICLISNAAESMSADWVTSGSAGFDGTKIILTPPDPELAGMAWFKKSVDLSENFSLQFKIFLGTTDDEGADGIVFALAPSGVEQQAGGGELGYTGITPSVAIEIDTYPNDGAHMGADFGDPLGDHMALDYGGSANHYELEGQPVEVKNLEDNKEHNLLVSWDADNKILDAYLDDSKTPTISYTGDIVNNFLEGNSKVMMGFTGSTGGFTNLQYIIPVNLTFGKKPDPAAAGWTVMESATWDGKKIVLTPDESNLVGAAWCNQGIDLTKEFTKDFKIYLGNKDDDGADGIVFVLAVQPAVAEFGEGLGYFGIEKSFAVEIDNHPNDGEHIGGDLGDPLNDHLAIDVNGNPVHFESVLPIVEVENLEDGIEHNLRITWNPKTTTLLVFLDDMKIPKLEYVGNIVSEYLEGISKVKMGFTGSTGFSSNLQYVIPVFDQPSNLITPITVRKAN